MVVLLQSCWRNYRPAPCEYYARGVVTSLFLTTMHAVACPLTRQLDPSLPLHIAPRPPLRSPSLTLQHTTQCTHAPSFTTPPRRSQGAAALTQHRPYSSTAEARPVNLLPPSYTPPAPSITPYLARRRRADTPGSRIASVPWRWHWRHLCPRNQPKRVRERRRLP